MVAPSLHNCPLCQKDDRVQKVTAAVSDTTGTLPARLAKPGIPPKPEYHSSEYRPSAPPRPTAPPEQTAGPWILLGILMVVFGTVAVAAWVNLAKTPSSRTSADFPPEVDTALLAISGIALLGVLGIAVVIEFVYLSRENQHTKAEEARKLEYAKAEEARKLEYAKAEEARKLEYASTIQRHRVQIELVLKAQKLWEDQLYYCHRDDVVFLANGGAAVPPEKMNALLGLA